LQRAPAVGSTALCRPGGGPDGDGAGGQAQQPGRRGVVAAVMAGWLWPVVRTQSRCQSVRATGPRWVTTSAPCYRRP